MFTTSIRPTFSDTRLLKKLRLKFKVKSNTPRVKREYVLKKMKDHLSTQKIRYSVTKVNESEGLRYTIECTTP